MSTTRAVPLTKHFYMSLPLWLLPILAFHLVVLVATHEFGHAATAYVFSVPMDAVHLPASGLMQGMVTPQTTWFGVPVVADRPPDSPAYVSIPTYWIQRLASPEATGVELGAFAVVCLAGPAVDLLIAASFYALYRWLRGRLSIHPVLQVFTLSPLLAMAVFGVALTAFNLAPWVTISGVSDGYHVCTSLSALIAR